MTAATTDRRIDRLISLLVRNATVVVPGPKIAAEIGVTRSAVWTWIERLRSLGVAIKGHPASGYQLQAIPDILLPSLIRSELGDSEMGRKIVHYFSIGSTNDVARRIAARGGSHGTLVVAEEQTAGRGRLGRSWYSEKSSGIYASVVLRPPLSPAAAPILTLMAAVAAQRALVNVAGVPVDIRWPNDLLVNGRKVGGILTEMEAELDRLHAVVLGVGINVNHRVMPAELKAIATSLCIETRKTYSRVHILVNLLRELERQYRCLLEEGSAAVAHRWALASSYAQGRRIRVRTASEEYLAVTEGIEPSGALRVRRENGQQELLLSGEIVEVK